MEKHFDVDRIVSIQVIEIRESHYKWLPRKRKTWFFGLFNRISWYNEGYYNQGCYYEWSEGGCYDAYANSAKELIDHDYLVDELTKTVYNKSHVTVYLEHEYTVTKDFDSNTEAYSWVSALREKSKKNFEVVTY
jgi:hypothetical protein